MQVQGVGLAGAELLERAHTDKGVHTARKVFLVTHEKDLCLSNIAFFRRIQLLVEELADECDVLWVEEAVNLIHDK